jgi:hypothetical protein
MLMTDDGTDAEKPPADEPAGSLEDARSGPLPPCERCGKRGNHRCDPDDGGGQAPAADGPTNEEQLSRALQHVEEAKKLLSTTELATSMSTGPLHAKLRDIAEVEEEMLERGQAYLDVPKNYDVEDLRDEFDGPVTAEDALSDVRGLLDEAQSFCVAHCHNCGETMNPDLYDHEPRGQDEACQDCIVPDGEVDEDCAACGGTGWREPEDRGMCPSCTERSLELAPVIRKHDVRRRLDAAEDGDTG